MPKIFTIFKSGEGFRQEFGKEQ